MSGRGSKAGLWGPLRAFAADLAAHAGGALPGLFLLLFLGSLVEGVGILLLVPLLSVVIGSVPAGTWLGDFTSALVALSPGDSRIGRLLFVLALFALLFAARAWLILRRDVALARLQASFIEEKRLRLVTLLARTRWHVLARLRHGRVTHALGSDVDNVAMAAHLLLQTAVALAILGGQLVLALLISPLLAALIFVLLAAGALALRPLLRRARDVGTGLAESNLGLLTTTGEFLGGLKLAISQNLQKSFTDEFASALARASARRVDFARQRSASQLALAGTAAAVAAAAILMGVGFLDLAPAAAIAFLFILGRMNGPAAQVQNGLQYVFHSLPAYAHVTTLIGELAAGAGEAPATVAAAALRRARVELRDATFLHAAPSGGGEPPGLRNATLRIEPGEFLGLAGPSGAGKTTLLDLLVGLYPPQQGEVLVDGRSLEGATLAAWREAVSYVSQEPFLFHDSIRRNLLWARPDASEAELWEALEAAGAGDLVRRLPSGLDTIAGERGGLLSGGERQRIALARALVRRPAFLLLDEATSALDLEGEREIMDRLAARPDRPATLIVAHRAESLARCGRIVEIREGRLVNPLKGEGFPSVPK